ncbi:hypothetical protein G7L40_00580 [Paenibacillus polymyxa]|uniref:HTH HARE-type domain-containing protein n=1 Tax=Paenibacillus polymyxa TaxID=1406 RepID=A0A378XVD2_PAEPO|nr:HTH domain-containing protein [Paenibacillus polymyxa]MBE7897205.1 hypothetical protein [Paenibacillus polymyxa]MBG9763058.1 hypothetical protein [Paenibacillus polymyxa]MCC3257545.1 winged helix-turn-helix domain-containing protein [Paenibacillus polymyxa]QPK51368.1 hypothetical protein G7035_00575 [Paenibacillus polymyxa]QPK56459.1 hypothetical protein G7L40_00580 [Paenibacillus polymyxa]
MTKVTQTQAVIEAMKQKGGYATLKELYVDVRQVEGVEWKTKTPDATIRRIVQNQKYFFKIRAGLWGLNEMKDSLPLEVIENNESNK